MQLTARTSTRAASPGVGATVARSACGSARVTASLCANASSSVTPSGWSSAGRLGFGQHRVSCRHRRLTRRPSGRAKSARRLTLRYTADYMPFQKASVISRHSAFTESMSPSIRYASVHNSVQTIGIIHSPMNIRNSKSLISTPRGSAA